MRLSRELRRHLRSGLFIVCALLPVFAVLILPWVAGWHDVVPLLAEPGGEASNAPEILAELSSDLNSIAIAVIIGAAVMLREWRGRQAPSLLWAAGVAVVTLAVASCYAGVRFRFAVAEQILLIPLNLDIIGDRLAAQGALLLASFSALVYLAMLSFGGSARPSASRRRGASQDGKG